MSDAFPKLSPEAYAQLVTGPNGFVFEWVRTVLADEAMTAWAPIAAEFRLGLAQTWIHHNPAVLDGGLDRDRLAERLTRGDAEDDLAARMRADQLGTIRQAFGNVDIDDLGVGSKPRPIGVGLELVRLFRTAGLLQAGGRGIYALAPGSGAQGWDVIVSGEAGTWLVEGVNSHLLRPGWPPTLERVAGPAD